MAPLSLPTISALPSSRRILATNPGVFRILNRLSRPALLSLILDWLDDRNQALSEPFLAESENDVDDQDFYPAAQSIEELRELYTELQASKGSKREIVDRIIEGDWRNGISLYQLAMADMQYLYDHPSSQKWTALKVVQLKHEDPSDTPQKHTSLPSIPRFHPSTFLRNLQRELPPDIKAHYNLDRHKTLPILLLRIFILDSPYNTSLAFSNSASTALDSSKTIFVAFPDASPHIYVSLATSVPSPSGAVNTAQDARSLRQIVLGGIPKAFSRPKARYTLQSTNLAVKSLEAMITIRGPGRTNAAGGGWGLYAEDNKENTNHDTPLNNQLPKSLNSDEEEATTKALPLSMKRRRTDDESDAVKKRRKVVAQARFGNSARVDDGKGIERLDIRLEDAFPATQTAAAEADFADADDQAVSTMPAGKRKKGRRSMIEEELERDRGEEEPGSEWIPDIRLTFHGSHVFAGVRELVEAGVVDGERMAGWLTGEEGVSVGVVKHGRIRGFKGSGI